MKIQRVMKVTVILNRLSSSLDGFFLCVRVCLRVRIWETKWYGSWEESGRIVGEICFWNCWKEKGRKKWAWVKLRAVGWWEGNFRKTLSVANTGKLSVKRIRIITMTGGRGRSGGRCSQLEVCLEFIKISFIKLSCSRLSQFSFSLC